MTGRLVWNPGTQVGKGKLPLRDQGAGRKGGQGLWCSRVSGVVEAAELDGPDPRDAWIKDW